MGAGEE